MGSSSLLGAPVRAPRSVGVDSAYDKLHDSEQAHRNDFRYSHPGCVATWGDPLFAPHADQRFLAGIFINLDDQLAKGHFDAIE